MATRSMSELVAQCHKLASDYESLATKFETHAHNISGISIQGTVAQEKAGSSGLNGSLQDAMDRLNAAAIRMENADMWLSNSTVGETSA